MGKMKFGLEAEKFLFNLKTQRPSEGVFRFIDALSDFSGFTESQKITNEFVLSMVEVGTTPSASPVEVLKDYLFHYLMIRKTASRENVGLVPLASLPLDYLPHMISKWSYFAQNCILSNKKLDSWMLDPQSPLKAAGNCAGVHVHAELMTAPEFHFSENELVDKFNMGLMMTPLISFSSSPYFYGEHRASSMRALRYYYETYQQNPLNGHLPPVMKSSADVLLYFKNSIDTWNAKGVALGLNHENLQDLTRIKGANWNPVRWNRAWNTIEIRCLDSDSIDLDCAKFLWIYGAMKRMDPLGEALRCSILDSSKPIDKKMIDECLEVSGNKVSILPDHALKELFHRAVISGLKDELVVAYLTKLKVFAQAPLNQEEKSIFNLLDRILNNQMTTSQGILTKTGAKTQISYAEGVDIVKEAMERQEIIIKQLRPFAPEIFSRFEEMIPPI
jgi:hypothetical protein